MSELDWKVSTIPLIERSKSGLSTKIHDYTDAFANLTGFYLTAGQAHDLNGADELLGLSLS